MQSARLTDLIRTARRSAAVADARLLARLADLTGRSHPVDAALTAIGQAANRSRLWVATAAVLSLVGGARGRRSAAHGLAAIGLASASVNGLLKFAWRRPRPALDRGRVRSRIAIPGSFSFPSGHAASATAFAVGVARQWPLAGAPVGAAAAGVAYSRIHTGVHYPTDVLAGMGIGVVAALTTERLLGDGAPAPALQLDGGHLAADEQQLPRRAVLLTSAHAGSAQALDRARAAMRHAGLTIAAEIPIDQRHRLTDLVATGPDDGLLVVAAGGDGTVSAAADAIAETSHVLGVLPLGTSNDFARSLGVPTNVTQAARLLATGKIATIDAGRLVTATGPDHHFVHAATVGMNAEFARNATQTTTRRRFGRLTYTVAAAKTLRQRDTFCCTLRVEGLTRELELVHLSVVNAPVFAGPLEIRVPGVNLDDRALDVIAVEHLPWPRLMVAGLLKLLRPRRQVRGIHHYRGEKIDVHTSEPLDVTVDGEIAGKLPASFHLVAEALRVVAPEDTIDVDGSRHHEAE